jgi:pectate lyase
MEAVLVEHRRENMKSSCPILTLVGKARDRLAGIAADSASAAQRACHHLRSLILPALLFLATVFTPSGAAGAVIELLPEDPLDSLPGATISTNTLRGAILLAQTFNAADEVVIKLKPDATYRIRRPTVVDGQSTEGTADDPFHGDFDIGRNLTIDGQGAKIDAQRFGRIFDIRAPVRVTIRNVTLQNGGDGDTLSAGRLDGGGAVRLSNGASVVFENVQFSNNRLDGLGYTNFERRAGPSLSPTPADAASL